MKNKSYIFDGKKGVDIWGDNLAGWTVYTGEGAETSDADYYKLIPTLYRAVQSNSYSVSTMPFALMKGKTEYDASAHWENKVGFIPNPFTMLQLINAALDLAGSCYLFRERSVATTKALRYHLPSSVKPIINKTTGALEYFERPVNGVQKHFKVEDYVYFWLPDPYVEIGPAHSYPALAAANACGVLMNVDMFAESFFERGAIKAMLLTVTGMPGNAERQKLAEWWSRVVAGIKNAFGAAVIDAESVKPVVVGEGMKELENVTIGQEKREDIAIALNIPMSILFANAANYATSQQDELNYLNKNIIPRCLFIESVLNEQIFDDLGLHWEFLPETLDAMQEDEVERSAAMNQFMDMVNKAESLDMLLATFDIYGMEVSDKAMAMIKKAFADKEKRAEEAKAKAEELAKQLAQKPEPQDNPDANSENAQDDTNTDTANTKSDRIITDSLDNLSVLATTFQSEMDKWKRKAINAMKKGKPANVDFVTTVIPSDMCETILSALGNAQSEDDVKRAFNVSETPRMEFSGDSIMALATEMKLARELLERTKE